MKIVIKFLKFIVMVILTLCLLFIFVRNTIISTILSQKYILKQLEKTEFYSEVYKIAEANFENYIDQSGLEENVLNNICTQEKVRKDINIIISNIYEGTNEEIDTTEIASKLNSNIDNLNVRTAKNSNAIDEFVNHICESYKEAIINTKYESQINGLYKKTTNILEKINKMLITVTIISIILLMIMNIKNISKILADFAIILLSTSFLQFIGINILKSKVDILNIKVFNDAFSKTIVMIVQDIFSKINTVGIIMFGISILFIIIYEIIVYYKMFKNGKRVKE